MKITVSEKTVGKAMQVVNNFFKKETARLLNEHVLSAVFGILVESKKEQMETYLPQFGVYCNYHELWKDMRPYISNPPILEIASKYETPGIPLEEGDIIEYKGDVLLVRKPHRNVSFTFVHRMSSHEEKEKAWHYLLNRYVINAMRDNKIISDRCGDLVGTPMDDLAKEIELSVREILFQEEKYSPEIEISLKSNIAPFRILLKRNMEAFKEFGEKEMGHGIIEFILLDEKGMEVYETHSQCLLSQFLYPKLQTASV